MQRRKVGCFESGLTRRCHVCIADKATEVVRRRNMLRRAKRRLVRRKGDPRMSHQANKKSFAVSECVKL